MRPRELRRRIADRLAEYEGSSAGVPLEREKLLDDLVDLFYLASGNARPPENPQPQLFSNVDPKAHAF